MLDKMLEMLREIREDMRKMSWEKMPTPDLLDATAYKGKSDRWTMTVVDFSIEDQGFSKGSRGYDGAATKSGVIMHLPREMAEAAFKLAQSKEN